MKTVLVPQAQVLLHKNQVQMSLTLTIRSRTRTRPTQVLERVPKVLKVLKVLRVEYLENWVSKRKRNATFRLA